VCARTGSWLCSTCVQQIELVRPPLCPVCGRSTSQPQRCPSCLRRPLHIDGIRAVGYLEGNLQTAIHRFKYSNLRPLATPLGRLASDYLTHHHLPVDTVVPVPLHSRRLRERGYNQAALLAGEIGRTAGMKVVDDVLQRIRGTAPQVGLNAAQRRKNVRGAFQCANSSLKGRKVLLVDDVCTTGATMESCSIALREAGASIVWGLALARERWHEHET
jgi:ComF family protein